MKNFLFTESMLSAAWFCGLKPDCSKMRFVCQNLVRGSKNKKKFKLIYTPTLGQLDEGYYLKIVLLNFTKLSVEFQLIEILAFIGAMSNAMQNQYHIHFKKRGNH